ncbi:MAG: Ppx/GppA family phosphatase [Deltaproteobacteria bacterium]|nr:Ppx/GppA family phosphatase [Deltaproteobacteria bacterium]
MAEGPLCVVEDQCDITRLGEGVDRTGRLSEVAVERTLVAVSRFVSRARELGVSRLKAVATAAVRVAENGSLFVAAASDRLGIPVEVIDGLREADLVARATSGDPALPTGTKLVFDVGGGSTELARVVSNEVVDRISLPIGAVRLTERFIDGELPSERAVAQISACVNDALSVVPRSLRRGAFSVVGVAGTVTTLVAVSLGLDPYEPSKVHGARLDWREVDRQIKLFRTTTLGERRKMRGLAPGRADVILAGAIIVARVLRSLERGALWASDRGVRFGLLSEMMSEAA